MTIASTTVATSGSTGNGATTQFSFSFSIADDGAIDAEDQIQVLLETIATGARALLTRGTSAGQYSVSINGDQSASPGGAITTVSTYSSSYRIWIRLAPPFTQSTDLASQSAFNAQVIEDRFDMLMREINVLKDQLRRAPVLDTPIGASFSGEITGPFTTGYGLIVNSGATGFSLSTTLTGATVSAAWATVIETASLALGLSAAGLGTEDTPTFAGLLLSQGATAATPSLRALNTTANASVLVAAFEGDKASPANDDLAYIDLKLSDSAGNQDAFARISWQGVNVTSGAEAGALIFGAVNSGTVTNYFYMSPGLWAGTANDQVALGSGSLAFSDLFLAAGGVINFNNGNYTITHAAGVLTFSGSVLSSGPTSGIGYSAGAGGAVTQLTNRSTGVTLSKITGAITTDTTSLAAEASATFTVTNTTVAATDTVVLSIKSGANGGNTAVSVVAVAAGSFDIKVSNNNAAAGTAETGAIIINFAVLKAVAA